MNVRLRHKLRDALNSVPVVGPVAIEAVRAGRKMLDTRRLKKRNELVPERFIALYKQRNNITTAIEDIQDPVKKMHADFAFSTMSRGTYARNRLSDFVSLRGKSYLDVGCAYGGFLVAFAHAGATRITGIDLNPMLLDYARALLADYKVEARVMELDVLAADRRGELGRFNVVTCNDVIEHVLDPAVALANLAGLLEEDGTLYMEIPNRHSAGSILSDGHYRIFGLTALPKYQADRYFRQVTGNIHDVTYKSLKYYMNILGRHGLKTRLISYPPKDLSESLRKVEKTFAEVEAKLSAVDHPSMARHIRRVVKTFRRGHAKYQQTGDREKGLQLFYAYGCDFWTILAEKKPTR